MARKVKDNQLGTRTARLERDPRGKPYYRNIRTGLDGGYRRLRGERDGTWVARRNLGDHEHQTKRLGTADDYSDANGVTILMWDQFVERARAWQDECTQIAAGKPARPFTVDDANEFYCATLERAGRTAAAARGRVRRAI